MPVEARQLSISNYAPGPHAAMWGLAFSIPALCHVVLKAARGCQVQCTCSVNSKAKQPQHEASWHESMHADTLVHYIANHGGLKYQTAVEVIIYVHIFVYIYISGM